MVLRDDLTVFQNLVQGKVEFALSALLKYLLRTTPLKIQVVTTNYDRIAEYACDVANATFDTGFRGGYLQAFQPGDDLKFGGKVVEILKVHGSLDWFIDEHQSVIALPDYVKDPKSYSPLLVTPGTGKYFVTHEEPCRGSRQRDSTRENPPPASADSGKTSATATSPKNQKRKKLPSK